MDYIESAKRVFDTEIGALQAMRGALDDTFSEIVDAMRHCEGKVVITAIGKPGHIAKKVAATLSSLGTPSIYLHPAEAMHGDLGTLSPKDIVIAMSYSGESDEVVAILPVIKLIGCKLIALTGNENSTLATAADIVQVFPEFEEACHMNLAPTSSTTVELCYCDALAVVASEAYGYTKEDFGKIHPAGALGKKLLLRVSDVMHSGVDNPVVKVGTSLETAIGVLAEKGLGMVLVSDENNQLVGIITDGDLRRALQKHIDIYAMNVEDMMSIKPKSVDKTRMAVDALNDMRNGHVSGVAVVENGQVIGTVLMRDIVQYGIV